MLFSVLSAWFSVSQNKIIIVKSLHARQAQKLGNSGFRLLVQEGAPGDSQAQEELLAETRG